MILSFLIFLSFEKLYKLSAEWAIKNWFIPFTWLCQICDSSSWTWYSCSWNWHSSSCSYSSGLYSYSYSRLSYSYSKLIHEKHLHIHVPFMLTHTPIHGNSWSCVRHSCELHEPWTAINRLNCNAWYSYLSIFRVGGNVLSPPGRGGYVLHDTD